MPRQTSSGVQVRRTPSNAERQKLWRLRRGVLGWALKNGRSLPWRHCNTSTYEKICVEVLLQRTRAETVAGFYDDFFDRFGDWIEIADTPTAELEQVLRPLGLWRRRAQSLKKLACYAAERGGTFPRDPKELANVPGVGHYVSNAIRLFQHGEARPLLDVNLARLLERYVRPRLLVDIRYDPWLNASARTFVGRDAPTTVNWAALDFAAGVCRARGPLCEVCPVARGCNFRKVSKGSGTLS